MQGLIAPPQAGAYRCGLLDPPWQFQTWSDKGEDRAPERHYPTMSLDEMKEIPLGEWMAETALVFVWIYSPLMPEAIHLMQHHGFRYSTIAFFWIKIEADPNQGAFPFLDLNETPVQRGLGYHTRAGGEVCLLFVRGSGFDIQSRREAQVIFEPVREHSRKPDKIAESIARMYDGPRLEMFSRTNTEGFDHWGLEVGKFG